MALSADLLPAPFDGVSWLIPGIVAVWGFFAVLGWDRRRIGLLPPSVWGHLWENKLLLLLAGAVALVAAWAYTRLGGVDMLDTVPMNDVLVVSVLAGVLGVLAAAVKVWHHRRSVPVLTQRSGPLSTLDAASKSDDRIDRPAYRTTDGKVGLLVHEDQGAVVLTPPIQYTEIDRVADSIEKQHLGTAVTSIEQDPEWGRKVRFAASDTYVSSPTAVVDAVPFGPSEPILQYVDTF
ncbi:hypothetical protein AB0G02_18870 [Actinosynnema sp. NPDC023658]|uniref:hypothetical protein n=1 Tax=Actinosynnema sp. NPDC023658 TaxID=3155465 RepID=UPI0033C67AAD